MAQTQLKSIKELREEKGLTIMELAEKTGVKARSIEKLEQGIIKGVYAIDVAMLGNYFQSCEFVKGLLDD